MQGEMCMPGYTNRCPCIRVRKWVLGGGQHAGRWPHTLLGAGAECVQRHAGTRMSMWALCRPLGCEHGLWRYPGVNPQPQHPGSALPVAGWCGPALPGTAPRDQGECTQPCRHCWLWSQHCLTGLPEQICKQQEGRYIMSLCVCVSMHVCYTARQNQVVVGCPASAASSGLSSLWDCCCPAPCTELCVRWWQLSTEGFHSGAGLVLAGSCCTAGHQLGMQSHQMCPEETFPCTTAGKTPGPPPYCVCPCVWGYRCFSLPLCLPAPLLRPQSGAVAALLTLLGGAGRRCARGGTGQDRVAGSYSCKTATSGEEPLPGPGMEGGG